MQFKDQCVVVTGAGSGIGRACALEFAMQGASVVFADIHLSNAQETLEFIFRTGGKAIVCETDVANPDSVDRLVKAATDAYGKVNALVNNAAIQVNKTVADTTNDEWNRQWSVNVGGVFLCSRGFLPLLRQTRGCIVNMSSVNGYFAEPGCAGYCATKAAIIGLTKAM